MCSIKCLCFCRVSVSGHRSSAGTGAPATEGNPRLRRPLRVSSQSLRLLYFDVGLNGHGYLWERRLFSVEVPKGRREREGLQKHLRPGRYVKVRRDTQWYPSWGGETESKGRTLPPWY